MKNEIHNPIVDRAWRVDRFATSIVDKPWTITGPADASLLSHFLGATARRRGEKLSVAKRVIARSTGPNDRTTSPQSKSGKIDRNCRSVFDFVRLTRTYPHYAHDYRYHFYLRYFYSIEEENTLVGLE